MEVNQEELVKSQNRHLPPMTRPLRRRFRGFSESHEFARHVDIATSLPEVSAIYDTDNQDNNGKIYQESKTGIGR